MAMYLPVCSRKDSGYVSAFDCRGKRGQVGLESRAAESLCKWTCGCECLHRTEQTSGGEVTFLLRTGCLCSQECTCLLRSEVGGQSESAGAHKGWH